MPKREGEGGRGRGREEEGGGDGNEERDGNRRGGMGDKRGGWGMGMRYEDGVAAHLVKYYIN